MRVVSFDKYRVKVELSMEECQVLHQATYVLREAGGDHDDLAGAMGEVLRMAGVAVLLLSVMPDGECARLLTHWHECGLFREFRFVAGEDEVHDFRV